MEERLNILPGLKISPDQYQRIGEISVMAGHLENRLKSLPGILVEAKGMGALALTAHLGVASLSDMIKAIIRADHENAFGEAFVQAVGRATAAYVRRNNLSHYTINPVDETNGLFGVRVTARDKIKVDFKPFSDDELAETLEGLITAYSDLEDCVQALQQLRGRRSPAHQGSRIHNLVQLASQKKP